MSAELISTLRARPVLTDTDSLVHVCMMDQHQASTQRELIAVVWVIAQIQKQGGDVDPFTDWLLSLPLFAACFRPRGK